MEMESLQKQIIDEILQEPVESSRGKRRQRAVKRNLIDWPIKQKAENEYGPPAMVEPEIIAK
ncbi:hypothetical protein SDC9_76471 [bioreactor metagenome]|uniref:Uncharacterized protein n=1 Tax=bioreactor metagenome TaxID=1076179 RepID=A0A644YNN9_9ZZZZ